MHYSLLDPHHRDMGPYEDGPEFEDTLTSSQNDRLDEICSLLRLIDKAESEANKASLPDIADACKDLFDEVRGRVASEFEDEDAAMDYLRTHGKD